MTEMKQGIAKSMMLMTVILMDLLAGMEFDLFVPSFPELQNQFHLSSFLVESLLSVNFLGYCISLFFVGGLADNFGRKPIILLGLIVFIIGSVFCLWPPSYSFLLTGRFLQGIGIAAPAILSFLIIADSYPLKQQQFWMAMLNGVKNTAVAIAPVIGSYITLYFHWHGNFTALLLLGILVLAMTTLFIPYKAPEHKETISFKGYIPLFQSRSLMLLMINIIFMFVPYWIFVGMSSLVYIKDLHVSLAHFGYYQGVLALVFAVGSVLFGLIMHTVSQEKVLRVASVIYIISLFSIGLVTLTNSFNPLLITMAFLPFIISQIIPSNILVPICMNFIPHSKGKISALLQGSQLVFSAMSVGVAGYFYQGSFQNIGIIISIFIIMATATHFMVIKNSEITKPMHQE
ncbi:MAG: bicyclomycin resistance protein [Gammaproteobacteria bacterium]|nr:bicyclomycin resistance protein [Gammaproteobacteria bacterium]